MLLLLLLLLEMGVTKASQGRRRRLIAAARNGTAGILLLLLLQQRFFLLQLAEKFTLLNWEGTYDAFRELCRRCCWTVVVGRRMAVMHGGLLLEQR